jgi:hypothetical protein
MRAVVAVLLFLAAREAFACSCVTVGDARDEKRHAALTFVGRAMSVEPTSDFGVRVTFEVLAAWRRDVPRVVSVLTSASGAACGYVPPIGEVHLLFAYRSERDGKFHIGLCSHNRPLACAERDLPRFGRPATRHETLPDFKSLGSDDAPLPYYTRCVKQPEPIGDHTLRLVYGIEVRKLAFTVLRDGSTRDVSFEMKCPDGCTPADEASVRDAVMRQRFKPAMLGTRPVAVRYRAAE